MCHGTRTQPLAAANQPAQCIVLARHETARLPKSTNKTALLNPGSLVAAVDRVLVAQAAAGVHNGAHARLQWSGTGQGM